MLESKTFKDNSRQRRLLFYDEDGNLVKTYSNPYLHNFASKDNNVFWNLMNPFFSFLRPSSFSGSAIAYMIPVSDEVIQQINNDPVYQNKLLLLSTRDPVVEANPLCNGKREPIPSPKLCSGFLNCWDGWAFEQDCPDGLLFSNNGYCDYTYNVDCSNRKLKEPALKPTSEMTTPTELNHSTKPTAPPNELNFKSISSSPGNIVVNSVYDSRTWTSMHVAMSRQDAIRQLKLKSIADIKTAK
ncbi:unnamed protein product, partial [Iphiclides podalirius]